MKIEAKYALGQTVKHHNLRVCVTGIHYEDGAVSYTLLGCNVGWSIVAKEPEISPYDRNITFNDLVYWEGDYYRVKDPDTDDGKLELENVQYGSGTITVFPAQVMEARVRPYTYNEFFCRQPSFLFGSFMSDCFAVLKADKNGVYIHEKGVVPYEKMIGFRDINGFPFMVFEHRNFDGEWVKGMED